MAEKPTDFEQVKQSLLAKYTNEEIQGFMEIGAKVANMVIVRSLESLIDFQVSRGGDAAEATTIKTAVSKTLKHPAPAYIQTEFKETDLKLNICLLLVDRDYKTEIDIPSSDYSQDLYKAYDALKQYAIAYWHSYIEEYGAIVDKLRKFIPDVNFDKLQMNENNITTLFLHEDCPKRIGIFCYYVNSRGELFYKRK
jgi:hypothetical protein